MRRTLISAVLLTLFVLGAAAAPHGVGAGGSPTNGAQASTGLHPAALVIPAGYVTSTAIAGLRHPVVGVAATPDGLGYWLVASDGGIFSFGDARFYGSTGAVHLNRPVVGIAATATGRGYWLVASDGGIFSFGDARFYGSTGAVHLNRPIVGIAATATGRGYWLVASDGGVFTFGDATFHGSTGNVHLTRPIVGMATTPAGHGYWLTASDGGIFTFGDATFHGSTGNVHLAGPVVGMAADRATRGYWLVGADGGVYAFGAPFYGSSHTLRLTQPVVGMAGTSGGLGYWLTASSGETARFVAAVPSGPATGKKPPVVTTTTTVRPATTTTSTVPPTTTTTVPATTTTIVPATTTTTVPAVTPPAGPDSVNAVQAGPGADISVTWTPTTPAAAATRSIVQLYLFPPDGSPATFVVQEVCGANCANAMFRELTPLASYEVAVWPLDGSGAGQASASSLVTLQNTCPVGACVTLDATVPIGVADQAAAGILHSAYPVANNLSDLQALHTSMHRDAPLLTPSGLDWSSWDVGQASGAKTTLILSDLWNTYDGTGPAPPWSDWAAYRAWVTSTVQTVVASGRRVDFWEVYNEPGAPGYYSTQDYLTMTPDVLLEQFLVAYQAIRAVLPQAAIIGPSLEHFSNYAGQYPSGHEFDLSTFLNFAAANNLQLAAVSWHEIDDGLGPNPVDNTLSPWDIADHVTQARQIIASLPALGHPQIFINEYGIPEMQPIPGWDVAYLAALSKARVDSAVRTCWNTCGTPTLDGLLSWDGTSTATYPEYYDRLTYAAMTGQMATASTSDDTVNTLGSYDPSTQKVVALIGRGVGCAETAFCTTTWPGASLAAPTAVQVRVVVPWTAATAMVSLSYEPALVTTTISGPTSVDPGPVTISPAGSGHEAVTFTIPAFADGSAYNLTVTPGNT